MDRLPKKVQERLIALGRDFVQRIPERMHEIRSLMDHAETGSTESLREFRLLVHRIAGSAATFGFDELGEAARILETRAEEDLAGDDQVLSERTKKAFQRFRRLMDETIFPRESGDPAADETEPPIGAVRHERAVILVGEVPGIPPDFGDQVAVFRFGVSFAADLEAVPGFCNARLGDGEDQYRFVVIVAAVASLNGTPERLRLLAELRERYRKRIVLILVGEEDDFPTRLRSVRYGADAFISTPIDVAHLVDRIDRLTHPNDPQPYHILIVDDDPEQVSDTALVLQEAGMITAVVTDPRNIFEVLVDYRPELILLDMYMPECSGAELASIIRQNENYVGVPILYLSVETSMEKQMSAIRSGGDGFLVKPIDPEHLVMEIAVRASRTRAMRFFMERDSLTGLLNHTNLKQHLEQELQRARRIGLPMVFVMIDLDHFKAVNDTYGHLTGDRVIKSLSRLLQERLRRSDTIGRYGGEEFGVILFNTSASWAESIMNEIRESFNRIRQTDGRAQFNVTFSCGIAEYPHFDTAPALNEAADSALYQAKNRGRNCVVVANGTVP